MDAFYPCRWSRPLQAPSFPPANEERQENLRRAQCLISRLHLRKLSRFFARLSSFPSFSLLIAQVNILCPFNLHLRRPRTSSSETHMPHALESIFIFLSKTARKTARKMRCDIIFTAPCHTADADLQHSGPEPRAPRVLLTVDTCSASLWPATPCPSYTPVYTATQMSENQPYGLPNLLSQTAQIWAT